MKIPFVERAIGTLISGMTAEALWERPAVPVVVIDARQDISLLKPDDSCDAHEDMN